MAILNSTVDRNDGLNYHQVLEADYKGNTPDKEDFDCPSMHCIEFIMRYQRYFQVYRHMHLVHVYAALLIIIYYFQGYN